MRFKVSMINDTGNRHEETVIANNEKEAKNTTNQGKTKLCGFTPKRSCFSCPKMFTDSSI